MTIYGKPLFIGSATPKLPEIFGDGSDGDLVIQAGDTVTLPVPVPHQSVVEKQYKSITIEAGGTLTTSDPNAGLVLRCQGDCTIHGTIDQSGKAPKTNPDSTYPYPEELQCGDGGAGGTRTGSGSSGAGMPARSYGGGYGGGGAGGGHWNGDNWLGYGGAGGSSVDSTVLIDAIFVGGDRYAAGSYGGGGGGDAANASGGNGAGGDGMTGSGTSGASGGGGGGGAGNYGGGVVLLYVGGNVFIDGNILCNGLGGGNGGNGHGPGSGTNSSWRAAGGSGGGGGGGGAIYILHNGTNTITGALSVNAGAGGSPGLGQTLRNVHDPDYDGAVGAAGGIGTATVKQYEETA